jgi:hypothetical protein
LCHPLITIRGLQSVQSERRMLQPSAIRRCTTVACTWVSVCQSPTVGASGAAAGPRLLATGARRVAAALDLADDLETESSEMAA